MYVCIYIYIYIVFSLSLSLYIYIYIDINTYIHAEPRRKPQLQTPPERASSFKATNAATKRLRRCSSSSSSSCFL